MVLRHKWWETADIHEQTDSPLSKIQDQNRYFHEFVYILGIISHFIMTIISCVVCVVKTFFGEGGGVPFINKVGTCTCIWFIPNMMTWSIMLVVESHNTACLFFRCIKYSPLCHHYDRLNLNMHLFRQFEGNICNLIGVLITIITFCKDFH